MVELANGSHVQLSHECEVHLRIPTQEKGVFYKKKVPCFELDLGSDHHIILGDNWLCEEHAQLDYGTRSVHLHQKKLTLLLTPPLIQDEPKSVLLSAIQMRKVLSKSRGTPLRCFLVTVTDPKVAVTGRHASSLSSDEQVVIDAIPNHVSPKVREIIQRYHKRFSGRKGPPPDRGIGHVINEVPGSNPVYRAPYRLSPAEVAELEKQIKELITLGLIEPSTSPYGAPILFAPKPQGGLRMCCDWRKLNSQTVKNRYPLPRIDQLLDHLQGCANLYSFGPRGRLPPNLN